MPKIDPGAIEWKGGSVYPAPFGDLVSGREKKRLGEAARLTQFGVNLTRIAPGSASAQRHWHENEDEFLYILSGEGVLVEDDGETELRPGDAAGFKAGVPNGHHLVNRGTEPLMYLEIGTRSQVDAAHYPDIDLHGVFDRDGDRFLHKNGKPYD